VSCSDEGEAGLCISSFCGEVVYRSGEMHRSGVEWDEAREVWGHECLARWRTYSVHPHLSPDCGEDDADVILVIAGGPERGKLKTREAETRELVKHVKRARDAHCANDL
jgi:hypothetical protein